MTRNEELEQHREYILANDLHKLIDFEQNIDYQEKAFDNVDGSLNIPLPPEADDLVRLHKLIRTRKSFTVLEFGIGFSTLVIADALKKNEDDWKNLEQKPEIRNRYMFQIFSVDASQQWIDTTEKRLPNHLRDRIHLKHSDVKIGTYRDQLCHYYTDLPDVIADFIYLDGPSPKDVKGSINGMSFQCDERTVMSADLLLMEPTLLPGTMILVDGRSNNARFLERNFLRNFRTHWDQDIDVTTFELDEPRLGKYNLLGSDFF